jgi:hypothetical protein
MKYRSGRPSKGPVPNTQVAAVSPRKSMAMGGAPAGTKKGTSQQVGNTFKKRAR